MASTLYGFLDLVKNELRNAAVQNLGTAPQSPVKGQLYFDTVSNALFFWDGSTWQNTKQGGITYGTVTAETVFGGSAGNGVSSSVARADHAHGNPLHDGAAHATIPLSSLAVPVMGVDFNFMRLTNLGSAVNPTDGVNKSYVDNAIQGLDAKPSVKSASTANLTLSGEQTIDGVFTAANFRVLVKNQTTAAQNGIYVVSLGAWTRALDLNDVTELPGAYTWVEQGTTQGDTGWVCTNDTGGTMEVTAINWTQFSGAGNITAGAGLTKTANTIDLVAGDSSLTVAADSVVVNTSVIATQAFVTAQSFIKKVVQALVGTASPEVVTHNLATRDIQVMVLNGASPYTAVEVDWDATTINTATLRYSPNLGAGYRAVVVG